MRQVLGDLVLKTGPSLRPFLVALLPGLVGKLGDSKIVVRQATVKVLRQLHGSLGQAAVLAAMEEVYDVSSSGAAKEEIVAAVITMLPDGAGSDADVVGVMRMLSGIVKHRDG